MKRIISLLCVILLSFGFVACSKSGDKEQLKDTSTKPVATDTVKKETPKVEEKKEASKISYDNFLKIKMDSKYEDVVALVGEGTELTSSEISGIKTVMYTWNAGGIGNMNVTIQNSVVISKTAFGLTSIDANVTLEQYEKVQDGMSYSQVNSILGDGVTMSQSKIMDMESMMYVWSNKNASNMNCTFMGDKMIMKAQFGLK